MWKILNKQNMTFSDHASKKLVGDTYELCAPLREHFNLTGFAYDMSFPGAELSILTDQVHVVEPYYYHDLYPICSDRLGRSLPNGTYTTNLLESKEASQCKTVFKSELGIHFVAHLKDYDEMVSFAFAMPQNEFDHFILNHIRKLQNFIAYFRRSMQKEITFLQRKESRLYFPELEQVVSPHNPLRSIQSEASKVIYLEDGSQVSLPSQQAACLSILAQGKSVKQIAFELGLSVRTVENYLKIIRDKLSCTSLITLCSKYGDQF